VVDVFKVGSQLFTRVGPRIIELLHAGANYIVVGRSIIAAADPAEVARAIAGEMASAACASA
jgi:orotidine-5'-phosphate decarboxylase